jgi:hypothetical protein
MGTVCGANDDEKHARRLLDGEGRRAEAWRGRETWLNRVCSTTLVLALFVFRLAPCPGRRLLSFGITPLARGEGGPVRFFKTVRNRARRLDFSFRYRQRVEESVQIFPQDDCAFSKFSDRELPGRDGFVKPRASEAPGVAGLVNGEAAFFGRKISHRFLHPHPRGLSRMTEVERAFFYIQEFVEFAGDFFIGVRPLTGPGGVLGCESRASVILSRCQLLAS